MYLATRGFIGACIDYRAWGDAKFPASIQDAKAAVRWLRANASKYKLRGDRIGAAGGSAGGTLAALLGTTAGLREFEGDGGNAEDSSEVQAVAAFNPVADVLAWNKNPRVQGAHDPAAVFLGVKHGRDPELYRKASPITYVSRSSAPFLFLHGTADKLSPYAQSTGMLKKLQAAGVHAEIFTAEGGQHGFFQTSMWFWVTLRRMESFFAAHLKK